MIKNWEKVGEEEIKVGFRKLLKREFLLPDGRKEDFYVKKEGPTVCVLPITQDGNVVLAKQFRPGPESVLYELPGGMVDVKVGPEVSVEQELIEETGYKGSLHFVGESLDD